MAVADPKLANTIDSLVGSLTPVRRLRPPLLRAGLWLLAPLALAGALYLILDGDGSALTMGAYVLPSFVGAILTTILAGIAAFQISLPDRSDRWLLLPLPGLLVWVGFAGLGCLADLGSAEAWGMNWPEIRECLVIILGTAVPLSLVLILMLRRARPERVTRVALSAGLACAAAAGGILILVHPHNSTTLDLAIHGLCVLAVLGLNAILGGWLLSGTRTREQG